ncbi:MAG: cytochrome c biogenesis protein CcsA [Chitinophagales bacterium]
MDIQYVGENLIPGMIGRGGVVFAFVFALSAFISWWAATSSKNDLEEKKWSQMATVFFGLHALGVFTIIAALFYLISNHLFEYYYAWQHASHDLPPRYLLSCFWEGQEGSFLLWLFWHVILGGILLKTAKGKLKAPVLSIVALTQVVLASMLLGIEIGGTRIGSNPFILLREALDAPIFSRPDYMSFVEDGNGLNPLLQNYWMTIHPPTLFLGFALTLVPFAYSIASLWIKDYTNWVKPALNWTLVGGGILGTGILMGGAWAYEALTFGGFWAWDPVENASLVPWLTLVAGMHTLVVYKNTKHALKASYILLIISFLLILYSTFLTRSGILGDSSVHSFTDLGMSGQLLVFMFLFLILGIVMLAIRWKQMPSNAKEEETSSREFWMFVGALVFLISAIQISFSTSIPVFNKFFPLFRSIPGIGHFFEKDLAPPIDVIAHYNNVQVWIAIILAIMSATIQYLSYKKTRKIVFIRSLVGAAISALSLSVITAFMLEIWVWYYLLLTFAAFYTIIANALYISRAFRKNIKAAGGSIAHIGFGLLILGILISNYKQEVISINTSGIDFGDSFDKKAKRENILLRKDQPVKMSNYLVTYVGDTVVEPNHYYKVRYERLDENELVVETFELRPNAQINPNMGLIANPDTRHYLTRDVYTHVTSVPDKSEPKIEEEDYESMMLSKGDTFYTARAIGVFESVTPFPESPLYEKREDDIAVGINLVLYTLDGKKYTAQPVYLIRDERGIKLEDEVEELKLRLRIDKLIPETEQVKISMWQEEGESDFIIMKAIVFPYINVLWLGSLVMVIGFLLSAWNRHGKSK